MSRFGPQLGAEETGASLYELPPGQAVCPYHYEYGEEEWMLVLEGRASVRTPDGTEQLEPFELAFFPKGPEGAHQIRNDTDSTVRVLMWSAVVYPTATAYPDSDKVGIWTGSEGEDLLVMRSSRVGYFHGETDDR
ncbi:MAG: cupin domain-containing protein [Actinomycetota bacterium]|nr:cupin domain-containing protein [Actinomycetota bacterium]